MKNEVKSFAFWLAVVALIVSAETRWDTAYRSDLDIYVGKEARLFVTVNNPITTKAAPIIFLSLTCVNSGGKTAVLRDTKLTVRIKSGGKLFKDIDFLALREVDNFLYARGDFLQEPVLPIIVLGKSAMAKQILYAPASSITQNDIPQQFELVIDLYVMETSKWKYEGTYSVTGRQEVWQDIETGGPKYQERVWNVVPL